MKSKNDEIAFYGLKLSLTSKCNCVSLLWIAATNGKPSQNNGTVGVYGGSSGRNSVGAVDGVSSGKTNRGPPNLGDLFAGGIPRLRSTANSSQLGECSD